MKKSDSEREMISIGRSVIRPDVPDKVRGRAVYVADVQRQGMLHAATVRSAGAAMKNIQIDTSTALKMPGVERIITASDIPGSRYVPLILSDQPFLAWNEVRFYGEPVALVVARTRQEAKKAARVVAITGEVIDPVLTVEDSVLSESPGIFEGDSGVNIFKKYHIQRGITDDFWSESHAVIEREYRTPHQEHAYLETQGMIAETDENGTVQVMGSMQCPFYIQDAVAAILGVSRAKITVIQMVTGGGFGGKEDVSSVVAGHVALASILTGRPVSLIYDRDEDFISMSKRHPSVIKVKIGASDDGVLTAADIYITLDGGAYSTLSPVVLWRSTVHAAGPYRWKAVQINSRAVATNTAPNGAFRGFGEPQSVFALESAMDELAQQLDMEPLAFRMKNLISSNTDQTATGQSATNPSVCEALQKAAEKIEWNTRIKKPFSGRVRSDMQPLRGLGCSVSFYGVGLGAEGKKLDRAGAFVQVESDASIRVFIGNTEIGQGARGVMAQIASETLAAPIECIHIHRVDTSRVPDSGPTVASRTTIMSGNAVINACQAIRRSLDAAAASILNCAAETIKTYQNGYYNADNPSEVVSFQKTVSAATANRLMLSASGWYVADPTSFDSKGNGQGSAYSTYVWSANTVEVEIDPGTLQVKVLKLVSAHDIGKAINPREVCGQIEGGVLQGVGFALTEKIAYSGLTPSIQAVPDGIMLNPGFSGYICPTAMDAPEIVPIILENPYENGPFGARGIGEPPLIGVAPALANAVANALGVRVRELPVCPEQILNELIKQGRL
jgi:CO/xanthine dehydrogenase Mo-binding subunit